MRKDTQTMLDRYEERRYTWNDEKPLIFFLLAS